MKISSKSILSPGRPRDAPVSLSASLSRRLKTNGSLKGGQSPMFPTGGKKRGGCAFENPEPSSPKVTCIGQVRVKTKKQGKKIRTLSKRRVGGGGEVSFRRIEQCRDGINPNQTQQEGLTHRNQRWVHLPLTICEALRAFGAEVSCLFPCRSSCFSTASERGKEEKPPAAAAGSDGNGQSSCGAVFARWFVSLQDGDEGGKGRREIELVVGGDEEERTETGREEILRRHMEIEREMKDEKCEAKEGSFDEEEDGARVSICIPPKNALLLMRCRSDPVRMSALAHRFWESPAHKVEKDEEEEEDNEEEEDEEEGHENVDSESLKGGDTRENEEEEEEEEANSEVAVRLAMEVQEVEEKENSEEMLEYLSEELKEEDQEEKEPVADQGVNLVPEAAEENEVTCSFSEDFSDPDNIDNEDGLNSIQEKQEEDEDDDEEDEEERKATHRSPSVACIDLDSEAEEEEVMPKALAEEAALQEEQVVVAEEKSKGEKETQERTLKEEETVIIERTEPEKPHAEEVIESKERERESHARLERESKVKKKKKERENGSVLPDCLLLMMCEPKLSMEVSKETWVCSTDFIRWLPERAVNAIDAGDDPKKRISTDSNPAKQHRPPQQPPRSSCSFPAPAALSMATMIEQKLVNAVAYEPFVLTRCKSEPMRTAAAKLAPDSCFWKNRKLEPHRRATFGIGAAGVGF